MSNFVIFTPYNMILSNQVKGVRWVEHVACKTTKRNTYWCLVRKL